MKIKIKSRFWKETPKETIEKLEYTLIMSTLISILNISISIYLKTIILFIANILLLIIIGLPSTSLIIYKKELKQMGENNNENRETDNSKQETTNQ